MPLIVRVYGRQGRTAAEHPYTNYEDATAMFRLCVGLRGVTCVEIYDTAKNTLRATWTAEESGDVPPV